MDVSRFFRLPGTVVRSGIVILMAIVLAVLPLLAWLIGMAQLFVWRQSWQPDMYTLNHPYGLHGSLLFLLGTAGIIGSGRLIFAPMSTWRWICLPTVVTALLATAIGVAIRYDVHQIIIPLSAWATEQQLGVLLAREATEATALARAKGGFQCHEGPVATTRRLFAYNGNPMAVSRVCHLSAGPPTLRVPADGPPGRFYMHVSPDHQHAWFTATTLANPAGRQSIWVREWTGAAVIHHKALHEVQMLRRPIDPNVSAGVTAQNPYDFTLPAHTRLAVNVAFDGLAELEVEVLDVQKGTLLWRSDNHSAARPNFHFTNTTSRPQVLRLHVRHKRGKSDAALPWHSSHARVRIHEGYRIVFGYDDEGLIETQPTNDGDFNDAIVDLSVSEGSPPRRARLHLPPPYTEL